MAAGAARAALPWRALSPRAVFSAGSLCAVIFSAVIFSAANVSAVIFSAASAGLPRVAAAQPGAALQVTPAAAQGPARAQAAPAQEGTPDLALRRSRLDNGLRVVLHRDPALPTVAIGLAYGVGTRHEGKDEQGFARWLQHAMLGGSRNVGPGEHVRRIRDQGGRYAAWTSAQHTLFVDVLPAHALALGLWLEADRMKSLELSSAEMAWQGRLLELELAREARDERARGADALRALVFGEPSPSEAPGAGAGAGADGEHSGNAEQRLAALRSFHRRHYAPNNAVLTLSGSFEVLEALNLIQTYFGAAEAVELAPAPDVQLAARARPRAVTLWAQQGQGPALWQGWATVAARTEEHDALQLASVILGDGAGSRLGQLLVAEKGLARDVSVWLDGGRGPDLFGVAVQLRPGMDPEQTSRLVLAQIAALARFGPSAAELQRAQRLLETRHWLSFDGSVARVQALCEAELFAHDARLLETDLPRYRQVTREAVQRAVARHLRASSRSDVLLRVRRR